MTDHIDPKAMEAVAKAMFEDDPAFKNSDGTLRHTWEDWPCDEIDPHKYWLRKASTAVSAYLATARHMGGKVPDGWVLVPRWPTEEMKISGASTLRCTAESSRESAASWTYQSMLTAAPSRDGKEG